MTGVRDEIDVTTQELDALVPASYVMQHAAELVGGINATASHINTISSTYLQPLKTFNNVVSAISNVLYRMFLGVTRRLTFIRRSTLTLRWRWAFSPVPLRYAF